LRDANARTLAGTDTSVQALRHAEAETEAELAADLARLPLAPAVTGFPVSVFVLGPSRSGKTMMERLLAVHPDVCAGGESPVIGDAVRQAMQATGLLPESHLACLPREVHPAFLTRYRAAVVAEAGTARHFVNTLPGLIGEAARIAAVVPNARFVLMRRDSDDLVFRMLLKRYAHGNLYACRPDTARAHAESYGRMAAALARAWPDITLVQDYDDMVAHPAQARDRVLRFLGLDAAGLPEARVGDDRGVAAPYAAVLRSGEF
jgi:hypothetical protein